MVFRLGGALGAFRAEFVARSWLRIEGCEGRCVARLKSQRIEPQTLPNPYPHQEVHGPNPIVKTNDPDPGRIQQVDPLKGS